MTNEIKTIRLNAEEYNNVIKARNLLLHRGINTLNQESQRIIKNEIEKEMGRFTMGLIVGIAAALLIKELS